MKWILSERDPEVFVNALPGISFSFMIVRQGSRQRQSIKRVHSSSDDIARLTYRMYSAQGLYRAERRWIRFADPRLPENACLHENAHTLK